MKLLPLVGTLLISIAPVQAIEAWDELGKACANKGVLGLCLGSGWYFSAFSGHTLLCSLREEGAITPKAFADRVERSIEFDTEFEKGMWNAGIQDVLKDYPKCPIRPFR